MRPTSNASAPPFHRATRRRKARIMVAAVLATAFVLALVQGDGADAEPLTKTVFAKNSDTGVIDLEGNGEAEWDTYGPTNDGMAVGEQRGDGMNLKYMVPFELDDDDSRGALVGCDRHVEVPDLDRVRVGSARARGRSRRR